MDDENVERLLRRLIRLVSAGHLEIGAVLPVLSELGGGRRFLGFIAATDG